MTFLVAAGIGLVVGVVPPMIDHLRWRRAFRRQQAERRAREARNHAAFEAFLRDVSRAIAGRRSGAHPSERCRLAPDTSAEGIEP